MPRQRRLIQKPWHRLPPRQEELYNLLSRRGAMTVAEIAKAMGMDHDTGRAKVHTYLTKLAMVVPILVDPIWRAHTYELAPKGFPQDT